MVQKTILVILDGFGINPQIQGNAIANAKMPNFNFLMDNFPKCLLSASSEEAGLSWGTTGNSEIGHVNIGSGRVIWHDLARIFRSIEDKSLFQNPVLLSAFRNAKEKAKTVHILGIASDGGVHGHIEHLYALLQIAKNEKAQNIRIHLIADGRDTAPQKILEYLPELNKKAREAKAKIATISGRYFAMDRDKRWDRTKKAAKAMADGKGPSAISAEEAINNAYQKDQTDEFIEPSVIVDQNQKPLSKISSGDSVIFFNFRSERARQLTQMLIKKLPDLYFVTMTDYEINDNRLHVVFPPIECPNTLPEVVANNNLSQLHIAETEKYAHVTFFFAAGREKPFPKEKRILVPSPHIATYDQKPEMSALIVCKKLCAAINSKKFDFIVVNFANADMVGHTGNFEAAVKACEIIDSCLGKIKEAAFNNNFALLITADHGNAEQMVDPTTGNKWKEHTTNPVPFIFASNQNKNARAMTLQERINLFTSSPIGVLADIAPTILTIMGLKIPSEMSGMSLVQNLS